MANVITLIKKSWAVKSNIRKCLKFVEGSEEHSIAFYYKETLDYLEDSKLSTAKLDVLISEAKNRAQQYSDTAELSELMLAIVEFLEPLKTIKYS